MRKSILSLFCNSSVLLLRKSDSKFQLFPTMETGLPYIEFDKDFQLAFFQNGFNTPRSSDFSIKVRLNFWATTL